MAASQQRSQVIATYNVKGGVGKTSAAVNLAHLAAAGGKRTLLWDLDPQGAGGYLLDPRPKPPAEGRRWPWRRAPASEQAWRTGQELLEVLPAELCFGGAGGGSDGGTGGRSDGGTGGRSDGGTGGRSEGGAGGGSRAGSGGGAKRFERAAERTVKLLAPLRDAYDRVFLDCPPSLSPLTDAVLEHADVLLVPVVPARLSTRAFEQVRAVARRGEHSGGGPRILAFLSMVDLTRPLHLRLMRELRELEGVTLLGPAIPDAEVVERMGEERAPVSVFAPESPAALAYRALWVEIERHLG